jgi:hypothetical protein
VRRIVDVINNDRSTSQSRDSTETRVRLSIPSDGVFQQPAGCSWAVRVEELAALFASIIILWPMGRARIERAHWRNALTAGNGDLAVD